MRRPDRGDELHDGSVEVGVADIDASERVLGFLVLVDEYAKRLAGGRDGYPLRLRWTRGLLPDRVTVRSAFC